MVICSSAAALCIVIVALILVSYRGKTLIVFMNAEGRPVALKEDVPDRIYGPEADVFVREVFSELFSWDYVEASNPELRMQKLRRAAFYFDGEFFRKRFASTFVTFFVEPVARNRLVVKARVVGVKDAVVRGREATGVVVVEMRTLRVGAQGTQAESVETKSYKVEFRKGVRQLENPYGLYVTGLVEHSV
ncbi:MAG: hypothetical protein QW650_01115 [Thermofilum sp.]